MANENPRWCYGREDIALWYERSPMNGVDRQLELQDGRRLGYAEYGDPQGKPLMYFHGFPSSRLEGGLIDAVARRRQVRVIALDRPGYGLSGFQPGRRMCDWPDDVVALARALGLERFSVLGVSGGGPYALACAWKIPQRLTAVAISGGLGPVHDPAVLRSMRWHARLAFGLAQRSYGLLWLVYGGIPAQLISAFPQLPYLWETCAASSADRETLRIPWVKTRLLASVREGLRQGSKGALWDAVLYARDWSFRLEEIEIRVDLWHGEADSIVPPCHTEAIAQALPHKRVRLIPGEGHFSLPINYCDAILGEAEQAGDTGQCC